MHDFDQVLLTLSERWILFRLQFKKKVSEDFFRSSFHHLLQCKLITINYKKERSESGAYIRDGTYSLSPNYKRFRIYCRQRFFYKKLPIVISIIALIGAYRAEILLIIQGLMQLLKSIMGI